MLIDKNTASIGSVIIADWQLLKLLDKTERKRLMSNVIRKNGKTQSIGILLGGEANLATRPKD